MDTLLDIIRELGAEVTTADIVVLTAGVFLFSYWLMKVVLRADPLADASPRRNDLAPFAPLIPVFIWFGLAPLGILIADKIPADMEAWQESAVNNFILCISGLLAIGVVLFVAHKHFARGLKGFGLNPRTIPRDAGAAFVNLLGVSPVFLTAFVLTLFFIRFFIDPNFEMPKHQGIELLDQYPELLARISMIVLAVLIAPVFEEMLFRGFIQTIVFSYLRRPWISISATSVLFAMVHFDKAHWPALFVLSMCMGYAYEKSGSLFRSIFIHAMFNGTSVLAALYGQ